MSDARLQAQCESRLGSTLRGKWVLEKLVGVGGMAAVYAGAHKIGRRDAIKILHPEVAKSTELRTRFEQEAAVANSFSHPGAVEIRDIDVTEDGCPFLVMEFLSGETMGEWARRHFEKGDAFPLDDVLRFVEELLSALGAAHAQGIVHRDIKLDNIFITEAGAVKVLDFGIARLTHGRAITVAGARLGTAAYMAPEQVRGEQVDGRADLFSVGATLFRLLAKRRIHEANSEADLFIRMGTEPAPTLLSVAPGTHPDLGAIVDRSLKFRADERYPNAASMAADIQRLRAQGVGKRADVGLSRTVPLSMSVLNAAIRGTPGPESTTARTEVPPSSMGSAPTNPILPRATVSKVASDPTQAITMGSLATMQPTPQAPASLREVPAPAPSVRAPSATVMQPHVLRDVATAATNVAMSGPMTKAAAPAALQSAPLAATKVANIHPAQVAPLAATQAAVAPPAPSSIRQPAQKFSVPPTSEVASSGRLDARGSPSNGEWARGHGAATVEQKKGPPWIVIAIVAIVLAVGVGAALALLSSSRKSADSESDAEAAEPEPKKADKKKASTTGGTSATSVPSPTPTTSPAPTAQPTQPAPAPNPADPTPQPTSSSFLPRPSFSSFNIPKIPR